MHRRWRAAGACIRERGWWGSGHEPVLSAFLSLIERDMIKCPEGIQPLPVDILARAERLVAGMHVDMDAPLD
ncbi:type II toxin-antitoxin system PrlF family antitoxin [Longimicrobium sp.]|uniref:type II toxin-antitoxin system PrlF family antitoxin n=1 Tax=Longimicrobium sp. TaxID=2029185 RepID=UPI0039C964FD